MKQITVKKEVNAEKLTEIIWNNTPEYVRIDLLGSCYYEPEEYGEPLNSKVYKYTKLGFFDLPKWVRSDMIGSNIECGITCPESWSIKNLLIWAHCQKNTRKAVQELRLLVNKND